MKSASDSLHFHIDQPTDWIGLDRCVIIRGWCFSANGQAPNAVRLKTGSLVVLGVVGLHRPDVRQVFPVASTDVTGFEIRAILPAGIHDLSVEVHLSGESWQTAFTRQFRIRHRWLPRWLGGRPAGELIAFQMPAHMAYPARPGEAEKFPASAGFPHPRFSIVTPSFNQARFLAETMGSVLEQQGVDCDYIVRDGGSTDGSVAVIRRFATEGEGRKEMGERKTQNGRQRTVTGSEENLAPCSPLPAPRLVSWTSEPDGGQADAIAKGFAKTSGGPDDIMAWINSDDFYLPGALGYVADYFSRHPDVDAIYGHRIIVNEESQEIARWFLPKHDAEVLRLNDFVPQETLFWRRRIWDKVSGLDTSFKFAMDWDLLLRFQAAGAKIVRVPYFLACFRIHAAQKTSAAMHTIGQKEIDLLRTRTHGREISPSELESDPRLIRYLRRSAFIEFLWKLGLRAP